MRTTTRFLFSTALYLLTEMISVDVDATLIRQQPLNDLADGVEVADSVWLSDGLAEYGGALGMGRLQDGREVEPAFVIPLPGFSRGDTVACARLRFTALGNDLTDTLHLSIQGLRLCGCQMFGQELRPSQIPKTQSHVDWTLSGPWPFGATWDPLYISGPDITLIVNELLRSTCWPAPPYSGCLALLIRADHVADGPGLCRFADSGTFWPPVALEIYRNLEDAYRTPPIAGQVTDRSAVVQFEHLQSLDCYVAFGTESGFYRWAQGGTRTELPDVDPIRSADAGQVHRIVLDQLAPDTKYFGRLFAGRPGSEDYRSSEEFTIRTQRPPGAAFCFDIMSDPHLEEKYDGGQTSDLDLYNTALQNVAADAPDFMINLGDYALLINGTFGARTQEEARRIYSDEGRMMSDAGLFLPFYLVLGNHEAELGWLPSMGNQELLDWATESRLRTVANPQPDGFYTGNPAEDPLLGPPEDYYSWEWGDALFVVLDPFRSTTVKPHHFGGGGSMDGWDWTLGEEQYNWLYQTLSSSQKRWKFVFIHHLVGGVLEPMWGPYGRGGIEAVRYAVAGRPTFEWGGEDTDGRYRFEEKRPGWSHGDIHQMLLDNGVTAVFHGHDHGYVHQDLDGVAYQECPVPSDHMYSYGLLPLGGYTHGQQLPNSGHLRVTVSSEEVLVEYVRAFLPGDGPNGHVEDSYRIGGSGTGVQPQAAPMPALSALRVRPVPCPGRIWVDLLQPCKPGSLAWLYDETGRLRGVMPVPAGSLRTSLPWDLKERDGRPLPNGVYELRLAVGGGVETHRVLVVR